MTKEAKKIRVAILGASGYTGAELLRLLLRHQMVEIVALTADRRAGESVETVFPHLGGYGLPQLVNHEQVDWSGVDAVFCGLPHGTTQEIIAKLPRHLKVIDLSADFRLIDLDAYNKWYGHPHRAPELQKEAVYGLTELKRTAVREARLVANPGCYPTSAQLPLVPLLRAGMIDEEQIIIDAKSGVSGAGRAAKEANLFTEVAEGVHPYGIANHRHGAEIEQELSVAMGREIQITFTPHLIPMSRGILSTIYVKMQNGSTVEDLRATLNRQFHEEPFVRVLSQGQAPATRHVRGSNHCLIGVFADRQPGRAIVFSVIDNLVKGASGQAVQNMNAMFGLPEPMGLEQAAMFP